MDALVIGVPGACLNLSPLEARAHEGLGWLATAMYEVGSISGSFLTDLIPGRVEGRWVGKFSDQLEGMHKSLSGDACLYTSDDDLRVGLTCTERGKLQGRVEVRLHAPGDARNGILSFNVNLDQSYLPQMISAVRKNFPGL